MKRKNIALLLGDIRDVYSNAVSKGAMKAAKETNNNLLIVPGRYYQVGTEYLLKDYEYQYQSLFKYFKENNVDLIILCAGSVGYVSGSNERNSLDAFIKQIGDIPLFTVSGDAKGFPNVRYDNSAGIKEGIKYLIQKQHCRKIAMVGGPEENVDSIERVKAYRTALWENGKRPDEKLIVYGDFTERSRETIRDFLKNNPDVDGVVFANDRMAICGYDVARELGLTIGRDIAFLGFDNIEKGCYIDPPLASVDADAMGLGYTAVYEALKFIETGEVTDRIIPSKFVPRASICLQGGEELFYRALGGNFDDDFDFENIVEESFNYVYNPRSDTTDKEALFESYRRFFFDFSTVAYTANVLPSQIDVLRFSYLQLFEDDVKGEIDLNRFIVILEAMEQMMLANNPSTAKQEIIKRIISYGYKHLNGVLSLRESNNAYRLKKVQHEIYRISSDMVGFHDISDKTYASLLSNFDRFGIRRCYIYLFDKPIRNEFEDSFLPDEKMYLKAVLKDGEPVTPLKREQEIPISEIVQKAFDDEEKAGHLIMLNLFIRNMIYGVMLCDIPYEIFSYYESFNYQISSAVRIIRLLVENEETKSQLKESLELLTKHNIRLDTMSKSDELTGILNRRGFLSEAETMLDEYRNAAVTPKYALVGYADADGLKGVNDTFGHEEGDALIVATAEVLKKVYDYRGIYGRMGGDEFAALCFIEDENEKNVIEEEIKKQIELYNASSDKPYKLSISFGTFLFPYTRDLKILGMLESADKEMYQVKQTHRAGRRRGDLPT